MVGHEAKLAVLLSDPPQDELGGIGLLLHLGRQAGIKDWTQDVFGSSWREALADLEEAIRGEGRFGTLICSDVDVDNLDNVVRVAHHMGLDVDRRLPVRVVREITSVADDVPVFSAAGIQHLEEWLAVRHQVYSRLMPSRADFSAKAMVLYSVARGLEDDVFDGTGKLWRMTDCEFVNELLESDSADVRKAATDWQAGELWGLSDLVWMEGEHPPAKTDLWKLSKHMSGELLRPSLCYAIKEKRIRKLQVRTVGGVSASLGSAPNVWLLGLAVRGPDLTEQQNRMFLNAACDAFGTRPAGKASDPAQSPDPQDRTLPLFGR